MIVPVGHLLPAGGTLAVEPDTLGQAGGAEHMATGGGQEIITCWVGRSSNMKGPDSLTFTSGCRERIQADWALDG